MTPPGQGPGIAGPECRGRPVVNVCPGPDVVVLDQPASGGYLPEIGPERVPGILDHVGGLDGPFWKHDLSANQSSSEIEAIEFDN